MSDPVNAQSITKPIPGVFGENIAGGDGVFGHATGDGRGVVGVSDTATGVEGNSTDGAGVFGRGNPAGFFEGDVVITGSLSLQGLSVADILRLVGQLEQQVSDIQSVLDRVKSVLHL